MRNCGAIPCVTPAAWNDTMQAYPPLHDLMAILCNEGVSRWAGVATPLREITLKARRIVDTRQD